MRFLLITSVRKSSCVFDYENYIPTNCLNTLLVTDTIFIRMGHKDSGKFPNKLHISFYILGCCFGWF